MKFRRTISLSVWERIESIGIGESQRNDPENARGEKIINACFRMALVRSLQWAWSSGGQTSRESMENQETQASFDGMGSLKGKGDNEWV